MPSAVFDFDYIYGMIASNVKGILADEFEVTFGNEIKLSNKSSKTEKVLIFSKYKDKLLIKVSFPSSVRQLLITRTNFKFDDLKTLIYHVRESNSIKELMHGNDLLNRGQTRKVAELLSRQDDEELKSKFGITIRGVDIKTLKCNPRGWLNDNIINFRLKQLCEFSTNVCCLYASFWTKLMGEGYESVRGWTKKAISTKDIILIPVNDNNHWSLAVIHLEAKTIKFYDSMGNSDRVRELDALVELVRLEFDSDMSGWKKECVREIPQQSNGTDCGVFCCMYAECIVRVQTFNFSQENIDYFRQKILLEICTDEVLTWDAWND